MNTNVISVIILNWNGKQHLSECIASVQNQTYKNYEVILVDNGSTDGSQDFIKSNFPDVNLVCLDRNYGFAKGNNLGIEASQGEYIVLLNNDTRVEVDWLENLHKCISTDPAVGFCASKMISYYDNRVIDSAGDGFAVCGAGFKRGHGDIPDRYMENDYVFGACAGAAIYKREMLDRIGFLDENFFAIYEDSDLSFRAQLAGYKCKFAANAVVYHKVNTTLGKFSSFYVYYGHRNVELTYLKNMPGILIIKTIIPHTFYNFFAFGYFITKGKCFSFLRAKFAVLKEIKNILKKRKEIKKLKVVDNSYLWSVFEKKWLKNRTKGK
ncbi:MAG: glycosyltransferase family 2 protein [Bacillota bacterium]|nr:glycosyltransferase family 2 protein [Bacillota bacterium]